MSLRSEGFHLFSVSKVSAEYSSAFQVHFNMLMHQNEHKRGLGIFFGLLYWFTFVLGLSGFNGIFVICSADFICPWV